MKFIGTLTATAGTGVNHLTTAVPWTMTLGYEEIYLSSDTDGVVWEMRATTPGWITSAVTGMPLYNGKDSNVAQGPFRIPAMRSNDFIISIFNAGGTTVNVKVWGVKS